MLHLGIIVMGSVKYGSRTQKSDIQFGRLSPDEPIGVSLVNVAHLSIVRNGT